MARYTFLSCLWLQSRKNNGKMEVWGKKKISVLREYFPRVLWKFGRDPSQAEWDISEFIERVVSRLWCVSVLQAERCQSLLSLCVSTQLFPANHPHPPALTPIITLTCDSQSRLFSLIRSHQNFIKCHQWQEAAKQFQLKFKAEMNLVFRFYCYRMLSWIWKWEKYVIVKIFWLRANDLERLSC